MAKTKAKAKVKTVVKNKAKVAPKKIATKKNVVAKKAITKKAAPVKKAVSKSKALVSKAPIKKDKPSKVVVKVVKTATPKKVVKAVKPVASKLAKIETKLVSKTPEKSTKASGKVLSKKAADVATEMGEKRKKFEFPKKRAGRKPKSKGDEDDGFELLEVPKLEPINKKAPKKKFVIPVSQEIYVNPNVKIVAPPKNMGSYKKFELEFAIHASPYIIYSFLNTPAGLSEWFAENVNVRNGEYTFLWDGSQQTATLLSKKENTFIRFRWNDEPDFTFFEFRIVVDEITQDVAFWVTDFAEDEKSREASEMLWHSQIAALIHAMGA